MPLLPPLPRPTWGIALLLALVLGLSGCGDASLDSPPVTNEVFESYVALGNSITAGYQSDGINATRQQQSYAVLLGEQMGTSFHLPTIPDPGCPPPLLNLLSGERAGENTSAETCTLRETPVPPVVNNVAVPGAKVFDALSNLDPNQPGQPPDPSPNPLTTLVLGGQSQVEAAARANPTFATVWLGNNDILNAALSGETTGTQPSTFRQQYAQILDSLEAAGAQRGFLIGVIDVTLIPHFSAGQAYGAAEQQINVLGSQLSPAWGHFEVLDNCAPGNPGANTLVPFAFGFGELFFQALEGETVELDCAPDTAPPPVLTPSEVLTIRQTVNDYNARIQQLAQNRGWAYRNPNPFFRELYQANAGDTDPSNDLIPKFPAPQPDQPTFGRYFSEDGIHPTGDLHRAIAYLSIERINEVYSDAGVNLEQVSIPDEVEAVLP